jgi:phosphopantothenoylcysteine decarboxylase/phosphopantothenate--cysteine ligase
VAVMSAAVADYRAKNKSSEKIKKKDAGLTIALEKTTDILKTLGSKKKAKQILVGFALESQNEEAYALKKLKEKNADFIVLNSLKDKGAGFMQDTNKITVYEKSGEKTAYKLKSKKAAAKDIINHIAKALNL